MNESVHDDECISYLFEQHAVCCMAWARRFVLFAGRSHTRCLSLVARVEDASMVRSVPIPISVAHQRYPPLRSEVKSTNMADNYWVAA